MVSAVFYGGLALAPGLVWAAGPAPANTDQQTTKVTFRSESARTTPLLSTDRGRELVMSAAPREEVEDAKAIYGPVADYLTTVLGKKVVFKHGGNWGMFQGLMQKGAYDIVFDGPHFNSWRVGHSQHNVLLKIPGDHVFVVLVRNDNSRIRDLKQIAGRTLCAHAPPNLGTLTALNEFENPARQPIIVNIDGWKNIYQGMLDGRCIASVIPLKKLEHFEKLGGRHARIIFRGATMPDNALSAGPRLTAAEQEKITKALLSAEGMKATAAMREKYAFGKSLVAASNREFTGMSTYLKNEWGY